MVLQTFIIVGGSSDKIVIIGQSWNLIVSLCFFCVCVCVFCCCFFLCVGGGCGFCFVFQVAFCRRLTTSSDEKVQTILFV